VVTVATTSCFVEDDEAQDEFEKTM